MKKIIITIDGPSGSGKEKIAKYISKKYNFFHLDSGILYRRLTFILAKNKINLNNDLEIKKFLKTKNTLSYKKHSSLRTEDIGKKTSIIAKRKNVRDYINNQQRLIVVKILKKYKGCVIDGRDIGSKVFKNAQIKLFIKVNTKIRAKRRFKQLIAQGEKSIYSRIFKDLKLRDKTDINRKTSPLVIPKKAFIIDNSKTFNHTCSQINSLFNKKNLFNKKI